MKTFHNALTSLQLVFFNIVSDLTLIPNIIRLIMGKFRPRKLTRFFQKAQLQGYSLLNPLRPHSEIQLRPVVHLNH